MADQIAPQPLTPRFRGVIAATATPFNEDGSLNLSVVPQFVDFLLTGGVSGLMVGGTTGEFVAMNSEERLATIEAFVKAVEGRVPVIAHVGHSYRAEAVRLAGEATLRGADALTAIAPYYHGATPAAIGEAMSEVMAAAPATPFFVYDYPDAAGKAVGFDLFASLLDREPSLAGVKLSVGTFDEVLPYRAVLDRVCVAVGNDLLLPAASALGVTASVSGNATAFPDLLSRVHRNLQDSDPSPEEESVLRLIAEVSHAGAPDRLHELLVLRGVDVGPSRVRTHTRAETVPVSQDERVQTLLDLTRS